MVACHYNQLFSFFRTLYLKPSSACNEASYRIHHDSGGQTVRHTWLTFIPYVELFVAPLVLILGLVAWHFELPPMDTIQIFLVENGAF